MEVKIIKHEKDGLMGLQIGVWGCASWDAAQNLLGEQLELSKKYPVISTNQGMTGNSAPAHSAPVHNAPAKDMTGKPVSPEEEEEEVEGKMIGNVAECLKFIHLVDTKKGEQVARNVLDAFGIKKVSELAGDQHPLFIKKCSEVLNKENS